MASFTPNPRFNATSAYSRPRIGREAPIINPYDKFTQPDFDIWIHGITNTLRHALGHYDDRDAVKVLPENEESRREEMSEEEEDESMPEDSFAEAKARRIDIKGKGRDPREGPGLGPGSLHEPIDLESASEDEEEDVESDEEEEDSEEEEGSEYDQDPFADAQEYEDYSQPKAGASRVYGTQPVYDESASEEEEHEQRPAQRSDDVIELLSYDEDEENDENTRPEIADDEEEDDEGEYEDENDEDDVGTDQLLSRPVFQEEDDEEISERQPLEQDTAFPPHSLHVPPTQPVTIPDPWEGPQTYAEDFYSGGDLPTSTATDLLHPDYLGPEDDNQDASSGIGAFLTPGVLTPADAGSKTPQALDEDDLYGDLDGAHESEAINVEDDDEEEGDDYLFQSFAEGRTEEQHAINNDEYDEPPPHFDPFDEGPGMEFGDGMDLELTYPDEVEELKLVPSPVEEGARSPRAILPEDHKEEEEIQELSPSPPKSLNNVLEEDEYDEEEDEYGEEEDDEYVEEEEDEEEQMPPTAAIQLPPSPIKGPDYDKDVNVPLQEADAELAEPGAEDAVVQEESTKPVDVTPAAPEIQAELEGEPMATASPRDAESSADVADVPAASNPPLAEASSVINEPSTTDEPLIFEELSISPEPLPLPDVDIPDLSMKPLAAGEVVELKVAESALPEASPQDATAIATEEIAGDAASNTDEEASGDAPYHAPEDVSEDLPMEVISGGVASKPIEEKSVDTTTEPVEEVPENSTPNVGQESAASPSQAATDAEVEPEAMEVDEPPASGQTQVEESLKEDPETEDVSGAQVSEVQGSEAVTEMETEPVSPLMPFGYELPNEVTNEKVYELPASIRDEESSKESVVISETQEPEVFEVQERAIVDEADDLEDMEDSDLRTSSPLPSECPLPEKAIEEKTRESPTFDDVKLTAKEEVIEDVQADGYKAFETGPDTAATEVAMDAQQLEVATEVQRYEPLESMKLEQESQLPISDDAHVHFDTLPVLTPREEKPMYSFVFAEGNPEYTVTEFDEDADGEADDDMEDIVSVAAPEEQGDNMQKADFSVEEHEDVEDHPERATSMGAVSITTDDAAIFRDHSFSEQENPRAPDVNTDMVADITPDVGSRSSEEVAETPEEEQEPLERESSLVSNRNEQEGMESVGPEPQPQETEARREEEELQGLGQSDEMQDLAQSEEAREPVQTEEVQVPILQETPVEEDIPVVELEQGITSEDVHFETTISVGANGKGENDVQEQVAQALELERPNQEAMQLTMQLTSLPEFDSGLVTSTLIQDPEDIANRVVLSEPEVIEEQALHATPSTSQPQTLSLPALHSEPDDPTKHILAAFSSGILSTASIRSALKIQDGDTFLDHDLSPLSQPPSIGAPAPDTPANTPAAIPESPRQTVSLPPVPFPAQPSMIPTLYIPSDFRGPSLSNHVSVPRRASGEPVLYPDPYPASLSTPGLDRDLSDDELSSLSECSSSEDQHSPDAHHADIKPPPKSSKEQRENGHGDAGSFTAYKHERRLLKQDPVKEEEDPFVVMGNGSRVAPGAMNTNRELSRDATPVNGIARDKTKPMLHLDVNSHHGQPVNGGRKRKRSIKDEESSSKPMPLMDMNGKGKGKQNEMHSPANSHPSGRRSISSSSTNSAARLLQDLSGVSPSSLSQTSSSPRVEKSILISRQPIASQHKTSPSTPTPKTVAALISDTRPPLLHKHSSKTANMMQAIVKPPGRKPIKKSNLPRQVSQASATISHPSTPSRPIASTSQISPLPGSPSQTRAHQHVQRQLSANAPRTRSNCRYHKISLPREEDGPRVFFLVPGCSWSLHDMEIIEDEEIEDHGDVTHEEVERMITDLDTLDLSLDLLGALRKLVGADLLREKEVYYLPGPTEVKLKAPQKKTVGGRGPAKESLRDASSVPGSPFNASVRSPASTRAPISAAGSTSTSVSVPFHKRQRSMADGASIASTSSSESSDDEEYGRKMKRRKFSPAGTSESASANGSARKTTKLQPRRSRRLGKDAAAYEPNEAEEEKESSSDDEPSRRKKLAKRGLKRTRTAADSVDSDGSDRKAKKLRTRASMPTPSTS